MEHFETPKEEVKEEVKEVTEVKEEHDEEGLLVEPVQEVKPKKVKKPRKPMTPEHKAKLAENLKKARVKSVASRKATKKEKDIVKIKTLEVKIATEDKDKNEKQAKKEADLEARIEARLRLKLDNEYSHKSKDDKIEFLSSQLNNKNKYTPTMPSIQEEKPKPKEPEKPKPPVANIHSPFKHSGLFNKYRKY
tara:strand:- start:745 stop:1320 length:576 start_codon:yes stop_codon:yes gene_type:complete